MVEFCSVPRFAPSATLYKQGRTRRAKFERIGAQRKRDGKIAATICVGDVDLRSNRPLSAAYDGISCRPLRAAAPARRRHYFAPPGPRRLLEREKCCPSSE